MVYERGNPKNIIVGAAALFVANQGVALPNFVATGGGVDFKTTLSDNPNWTNVGYTMEGVEVSYEPDYGDVEVDQLLDSARIFKQGMRVMVNTTLAEPTFKNIIIAWGQSDSSVTGADESVLQKLNIEVGDLGDAPVERQVCFVGPGVVLPDLTKKQRVYHLFRAIQTESASMALRRTEATGLPVSFRVLPGLDSSSAASYGVFTERAVA